MRRCEDGERRGGRHQHIGWRAGPHDDDDNASLGMLAEPQAEREMGVRLLVGS